MNRPPLLPPLLTSWSPGGLALRVVHEMKVRLGFFQAEPEEPPTSPGAPESATGDADPGPLAGALPPELLGEGWTTGAVTEMADRVLEGEIPFFGEAWRPLPETPEEWNGNGVFDASEVWWRIALRPPEEVDVKDSWEPGRFHWALYLAAAYRITGKPRYRNGLLGRVRGWLEANPPYRGVQWTCGQETSLRLLALLQCEALMAGGERGGNDAGLRGQEDAALFRRLAWISGKRVEEAFGYAVSQRNNHHISEAVGLLCAGLRWGRKTRDGRRWVKKGREELERAVGAQYAGDGWYVQNSPGYQRFATEVAACGLLLAVRHGLGAPGGRTVAKLAASTALLSRLSGHGEGVLPTMGASDGSFFVPPLEVPARAREVRRSLLRVWEWLGELSPGLPPAPEDHRVHGAGAPDARLLPSGILVAAVGPWRVSARAVRTLGRPGHADLMHLNVRHREREVIVDPGSFRYNGRGLWRNALVGEGMHNAPFLEREALTKKGPGFLWLRFPQGSVEAVEEEEDGAVRVVMERSDGARRELRVREEGVVVRDRRAPGTGGPLLVRWTLHPDRDPTWVGSEPPGDVKEGTDDAPWGWYAPGYGVRMRTRIHEIRAAEEVSEVVTTIRPPEEPSCT